MKRIRLAETDRAEALQSAVQVIRGGGIVLYPTDTVYGLGCDPFSEAAVKRLSAVKKRPDTKLFLILVLNGNEARPLASSVPDSFGFLAERVWPGPITMIFEKNRDAEPFPGSDSIGIRCPRWHFLRDFLRLLGSPLISTSANRAGEAPIGDPEQAWQQFSEVIDLFLDFGKLPQDRPSTLVDLRYDPPKILREGAMLHRAQDAIEEWRRLTQIASAASRQS
jgi:L-threonylcarbamoyladenylate synthase